MGGFFIFKGGKMKFVELLQIIQDESKSEDYLRSVGILKTFTNCHRCNGTSLGLIRGDRWKCYKCKTEWTRRKDSLLSLVRIKYSEFLLCLKCFELELTAEEVSKQLKLNYKTVIMLFNEFRRYIAGYSIEQIAELQKIMKGSSDFISINIVDKKVKFRYSDERKEDGSKFTSERSRISNSSTTYVLSYKRLKNFMYVGKGQGYFSDIDRFWRYAKVSILKFRGTDNRNFILFLKEIEFRFNNSGEDIFNAISNKIAKKSE